MSLILILTNNVENELDSYLKFRQLGYEILISSKALVHWRMNKNFPGWATNFPTILISETIPDKEAIEVSLYLKEFGILSLRKIENRKVSQKENSYFNKALKNCIYTDISIAELAEIMFYAQYNFSVAPLKENKVKDLSPFIEGLSGREKQLFNLLIQNSGHITSRNTLTQQLWNRSDKSELSQLSVLVKKINQKGRKIYNFDQVISTVWGQGYFLDDKFLETYMKNSSSTSIHEI